MYNEIISHIPVCLLNYAYFKLFKCMDVSIDYIFFSTRVRNEIIRVFIFFPL